MVNVFILADWKHIFSDGVHFSSGFTYLVQYADKENPDVIIESYYSSYDKETKWTTIEIERDYLRSLVGDTRLRLNDKIEGK